MHACLAITQEPILLKHYTGGLVALTHQCPSVSFSVTISALEQLIGSTFAWCPKPAGKVTVEVRSSSATDKILAIEGEFRDITGAFGNGEGEAIVCDVDCTAVLGRLDGCVDKGGPEKDTRKCLERPHARCCSQDHVFPTTKYTI
jgi:hypothetical protein